MDTDADRLDQIRALGGVSVRSPSGEFLAVFDNETIETLSTPGVETRQPVLTCRSRDVPGAIKDVPLEIGAEQYRVKRFEHDGTGMCRIFLKR